MRSRTPIASCCQVLLGLSLLCGLSSCAPERKTFSEPAEPVRTEARESPVLAAKVAAGELPPLEERLPKNPMVFPTFGPHASYGGTLRIITPNFWFYGGIGDVLACRLFLHLPKKDDEGNFVFNEEGEVVMELHGNLVESWEYSEDGTSITLRLRDGLRYSDGHPFTTEDIAYYWEIWNNTEDYGAISPIPRYRIDGEPVDLEVIDEWTFRFLLPQPDFRWLATTAAQLQFWEAPKHWLSAYDPNLNPAITGWEEFRRRFGSSTDLTRPAIGPWKLVKWDEASNMIAERNPYFYAVDSDGRQLPYIDRVEGFMARNPEVATMRAMGGYIDIYDGGQVEDLALLKASEERAGYHLRFVGEGPGTFPGLMLNFFTDRPHLAEFFRDLDFRRALSISIDRGEVNDLVFSSFGIPSSASFGPWFTDLNIEYDPGRAAEIFAESGLEDRNGDGFLQYPDGSTVTIVLTTLPGGYAAVCELVASHWQRLGIRAIVQNVHPNQYSVQRRNRRFDLLAAHNGFYGFRTEPPMQLTGWSPFSELIQLDQPEGFGHFEPYQRWVDSGGEQGIEPPADLKEALIRLRELERAYRFEPDPEKAETYAKEIARIWAENILMFGIVGRVPTPVVIGTRLLNVPEVLEPTPEGPWVRSVLYPLQLVIHPDALEKE